MEDIAEPLQDDQALISTPYGTVPLNRLMTAFNATQRHAERRREWLQTDQGKEYNRQKAREYYQRNKQTVLERRANAYVTQRDFINDRNKQYYAQHRDEIIAKNKERRARQRRLREMGVLPNE